MIIATVIFIDIKGKEGSEIISEKSLCVIKSGYKSKKSVQK